MIRAIATVRRVYPFHGNARRTARRKQPIRHHLSRGLNIERDSLRSTGRPGTTGPDESPENKF